MGPNRIQIFSAVKSKRPLVVQKSWCVRRYGILCFYVIQKQNQIC